MTTGTVEIPGNNNISDIFRSSLDKFNWFDLVKLRAVIRNEYGLLERRYIYLPVDAPESQGFVEGYNRTGKPIFINEKDGHFYHSADLFQKNLGEIPANKIGVVTPLY